MKLVVIVAIVVGLKSIVVIMAIVIFMLMIISVVWLIDWIEACLTNKQLTNNYLDGDKSTLSTTTTISTIIATITIICQWFSFEENI